MRSLESSTAHTARPSLRLSERRPVAVSLLDLSALWRAVGGHEVVINLATHIPSLVRSAMRGAWRENDQLRSEGSRNLVRAAGWTWRLPAHTRVGGLFLRTWCRRLARRGLAFAADSDNGLKPGRRKLGVGVRRRYPRGGRAPLRLYGPDSEHTKAIVAARKGIGGVIGGAGSYFSNIHADDAAAGVVAGLGVDSGVYNVVESEPLTREDQLQALAQAVGLTRLHSAGPLVAFSEETEPRIWPVPNGSLTVGSLPRRYGGRSTQASARVGRRSWRRCSSEVTARRRRWV
jgi:hypothetical protein